MKMRKQKLLSMMLCAALTVTSIVSEGFSVSAGELQPGQQMVSEDAAEAGNEIAETEAPEDETEGNLPAEETADTENEKTEGSETEAKETEEPKTETKAEETEDETQTQREESGLKATESATEAQTETSESEEIEEEESERANEPETASQQETVEEELIGVYQFGDAPSERDSVSGFSLDNAADVNLSEIEEYLYQEMLGREETIDVQDYNIGMSEWSGIVQGVLNENPDLYYVNKGIKYSVSSGSTIVSGLILTYNDSLDDDAFQKATKEALSVINGKMSDLEKAIALHDYLALNCEYDEENMENNAIPDTSYSAYGALVNRMAVCQGYALAYKYLINRAGIDCYMVTSDKMNHAWNLVKLGGKYYQVDITWDDPVWDLVGRVRHQYMFRSDKAFVDECEHQDWYVTEGSKVVDYQATDASYDNAFWLESGSPLVMVGTDCYYIAYDKQKRTGILNKAALSDVAEGGTTICDIGTWPVWDDSKYWTNAYSGLFQVNGRLYYNDKSSIYSIALDDMGDGVEKRTEFTADTTDGYIYGSAFCQGKVLYSLHQSPDFSSRETVLTADVAIEGGDEFVGKATGNESGGVIASGSYEDITWVIDADGKLTVTGTGEFTSLPKLSEYEEGRETPWLENSESIKSAEINVTGMTDASYMFYNCMNLESVDLKGFSTEHITDMNHMFSECNSLSDLDLRNFDTSQVTNMSHMFSECNSLSSLDVGNFDTSQVTDMSFMFSECNSLSSLDVGNFDTSQVTDMSVMFSGCYSLNNLDVGNFDTSQVTNMSSMFNWSDGLISLELSNFNTSQVTDMSGMFGWCESLSNLNISSFNTSQVIDMSGMFLGCSSLDTVDVSGFDTRNATNMEVMFWGCSNLDTVDVSGFDTGNVTDMVSMFDGCSSLTTVDVSGFNTQNVTYIKYMFKDCAQLTSLDLSSFDVGNVKITDYYRISDMLSGCNALTAIYIPRNLPEQIILPSGDWYKPDGTKITELPLNLNCSMMITKDKVIAIDESYIEAKKTKTVYERGEILNTDDLTVKYFGTDGTIKSVTDYTTNADKINMSTGGTKKLTVTYDGLTTEIAITVRQEYIVTFELNGHGSPIAPLTGIVPGSLLDMPPVPTENEWEFQGWYKDASYKEKWDFEKNTVEKDITLYASWYSSAYTQSGRLVIQRIPDLIYTGSALKPKFAVYYQSDKGKIQLSAGTDYTVKYFNNIKADTEQEKTLGGIGQTETDSSNGFTKDLAYVVITCKGNYKGTVYQNFHINAASIQGSGNSIANGFTLKYREQLAKGNKPLKPFTSLEYKKVMEAGKDYTVKLTAQKAYDAKTKPLKEGSVIDGKSAVPAIPAGYYGTFLLTITGINNYAGTVTRTIYVAGKDYLMKNASVAIGKKQKSMKYTGSKITLTPAWYDVSERKYYAIGEDDTWTEAVKENVFTVKIGKEYLLYGRDFTVSYSGNLAVGTATMTITGMGEYVGAKKVTFRIKGTAFNEENISLKNFKTSMVYTGKALTQNGTTLTDTSKKTPVSLVYGQDYTISYKNNVKKGTATMTFTAKPASGYSGSFKKTFRITAVELGRTVSGNAVDPSSDTVTFVEGDSGDMKLDGKVIYTKAGAKPSGRIELTDKNNKNVLKQGTDYTVSYSGNKRVTDAYSLAKMTVTGKGNYKGSITVYFPIEKAPLSGNENLEVAASPISYNPRKAESYQYRPQIKITDKKKALSAKKDFEVAEYKNCSQAAVKAYLEALADGTAKADARPYAIVKARKGSNYTGSMVVDLNIYQTKLSSKNLYIVVSENKTQVTYTGQQVKPEVTVYYGKAKAIQEAKEAGETQESKLTSQTGGYRLTKLRPEKDGVGDYTLTYGANVSAGKNKGKVTVNGIGIYSGKVTAKFKIFGKEVYN